MRTAVAVAATVIVVLGIYLLMWRGWRRRAAALPDLPDLPAALPDAAPLTEAVPVMYLGSTTAGQWLDRVVGRSLGDRGAATVQVTEAGLVIERHREPTLHIPVAALRAVRADRAGAGRAVRRPEYLILTWEHGAHLLDTALRPDHHGDLARLSGILEPMASEGARS